MIKFINKTAIIRLTILISAILLFMVPSVARAKKMADTSYPKSIEKTNPKQAASNYAKYVKDNPLAADSSDAKFREGLCYEEVGEYYKAYKAYQHIIDKYPLFPNLNEILDRQYRIGNYFLLISDKPVLGINLLKYVSPNREKAIEIFNQIVKNAPFSEIGIKAQYRLGYAHMQLKQYNEAIDEFKIIIEKYPGSMYLDESLYSIGCSYYSLVQGPQYDQYSTEKGIEYLSRYTNDYPSGRYESDAVNKIDKLNKTLAESLYLIGNYYESIGYYESALIYYDDLQEKYPGSFFSDKAESKRQVLESIVQSELPYKQLIKNYEDISAYYSALRKKDNRNSWEIWKKDPLTPDQRNRLNYAKQLVIIAKSHVDEAKKIYEVERKVALLEIRIRDLQKDTQKIKADIPAEEDALKQLIQNYEPYKSQPDSEEKDKLKELVKQQRKKINSMKSKIPHNESLIKRLSEKLVLEKAEYERNKPQLDERWQTLLNKSSLLKLEIDKLIAEADDYGTTDISQMALKPSKFKWKRLTEQEAQQAQIEAENEAIMSEMPPQRHEIIEEIKEESMKSKSVLIPYENQYKGNLWDYWWGVLVGEEDKVKSPSDASPLLIK